MRENWYQRKIAKAYTPSSYPSLNHLGTKGLQCRLGSRKHRKQTQAKNI